MIEPYNLENANLNFIFGNIMENTFFFWLY